MNKILMVLVTFAFLFIAACNPAPCPDCTPCPDCPPCPPSQSSIDLEIVPSEWASNCEIQDGILVVNIKNNGVSDCPATSTTIEFFDHGSFVIPTPPIAAGATISLPTVPLPSGCHTPDCNFSIIVDSANDITEGNESNNTAPGTCIG
jgi:hypothetical protein